MDGWKYWLDLNEHIFKALELSGIALAIFGLIILKGESISFPLWWKRVAFTAFILMTIVILFQIILGTRKMKKDTIAYLASRRLNQQQRRTAR